MEKEKMMTKNISQLESLVGKSIRIKGWVEVIRDQKNMQFLIIRDETGVVQVAHYKKSNEGLANLISTLNTNSVVDIQGKVVENASVKLGGIEISIDDMDILSLSAPEIPIDKDSALDIRLDWRFIDLRQPKNRLIFEVQTTIEHAMRNYWIENNFIEIHSPKFMGSPSETGAELFSVPYFKTTAYLAQSPQFYKQMAMAAGFNRVFEIGPVFRANPSFTSRHDTEFTSVDMEMSWIDSHQDVMKFEEKWLHEVLSIVKEKHSDEIKAHFNVEIKVPELPFPQLTLTEAHQIIREKGHSIKESGDLDPEGERLVSRYVKNEFGHEFVFVTDYPVSVRPFYHMRYDHDQNITKSFDLLWKGLEVTTGAQREHRYDVLKSQAFEKGLSEAGIQYYLDFFKFGCPPHGGLGFGLTRMLMTLFEIRNVREVTYLYRGPTRITP